MIKSFGNKIAKIAQDLYNDKYSKALSKFPEDFCFRLTKDELDQKWSQFASIYISNLSISRSTKYKQLIDLFIKILNVFSNNYSLFYFFYWYKIFSM